MNFLHIGHEWNASWHCLMQKGAKQHPQKQPKIQIPSAMSQVPRPGSYWTTVTMFCWQWGHWMARGSWPKFVGTNGIGTDVGIGGGGGGGRTGATREKVRITRRKNREMSNRCTLPWCPDNHRSDWSYSSLDKAVELDLDHMSVHKPLAIKLCPQQSFSAASLITNKYRLK